MLFYALQKQREFILSIAEKARRDITCAPDGYLDISSTHKNIQYRWRKPDGSFEYLRKDNSEIAKLLAQKSYARTVLAQAERELTILDQLMGSLLNQEASSSNREGDDLTPLSTNPFIAAYQKLSSAKKELVEPYLLPDDDYIKLWESTDCSDNPPFQDGKAFQTEKGDLVRSKSEVIIADKLFRAGIPYKYELPFSTPHAVLHPDFTILKTTTRENLIWEHFGIMDDPTYCNQCMRKLNLYASQGLIPGRGLITTFESAGNPLSMKTVDTIVDLIANNYVAFSAKSG